MPQEKSSIKITYEDTSEGYNENRKYEGSFGKMQLVRTLLGIYNDIVLNHKFNADLSPEELFAVSEVLKNILEQGEKTNAN